jgi:transcriptional regulator with XRE-family HTH domain
MSTDVQEAARVSKDAFRNPLWEPIAKKIRYLMHNQSLTVQQVAERIGVTAEHLKYVVDGISKPTRHILEKLCAAFNVKLDFFGKDLQTLLAEEPPADEESADPRSPAQAHAADRHKRKPGSAGQGAALKKGSATAKAARNAKRKKRKFDLAELAVHHQALLECLLEMKSIGAEKYAAKVAEVRRRLGLD